MALMFVVAVALASQHHQELQVQVLWREKIVQGKLDTPMRRGGQDQRLSPPPPPLPLDLDGDGVDEIVTVQKSARDGSFLVVLSLAQDLAARKPDVLQRPAMLRRVALEVGDDDDDDGNVGGGGGAKVGRRSRKRGGKKKSKVVPIALGGGFLDGGVARIVVLTDDWSVLCFDKELELLWRRR